MKLTIKPVMVQLSLQPLYGLITPALIIEEIAGPELVNINGDAAIYPASMMKVPLAYATAVALAGGAVDDSPVGIEERFMTSNDAPSPFVPGYIAGLWELVHAMLAFSDNIATNALIDRVGRARATTICRAAELKHTAIRRFLSGALPRIADPDATGENEHSPADAVLLLRRIACGEVPFSEHLLNALAAQHWNGKLSDGLREGDRFAHKTGDTSDASHDGGILTTVEGKCYIIVLYSCSPSSDETDAVFARIMREIRPQL